MRKFTCQCSLNELIICCSRLIILILFEIMLALSSSLSYKNERENYDLFQDFSHGNLIDTIDFDDFFDEINGGDLLPDFEIFCEQSAIHGNMKSKEAKKSSSKIKNPQGKKKVKLDWTPELHRKFVKAIEKLGVDKAVPSRILELMATHGLTRHNIASHLQKYRAHRKHLLTREAEAASLNHKKQMYSGATTIGGGGKRILMNPWPAPPTMGFPPMAHHVRPLHVWGHPHVNNSFWHPHYQRVSNSLVPGTPCFPAPITSARFAAPLMVPGIPPSPAIIKVDTIASDLHPSNESIDAAIEDVLAEPQLPLPIGLKPPSIDSVLNELQRQGITKIPPT